MIIKKPEFFNAKESNMKFFKGGRNLFVLAALCCFISFTLLVSALSINYAFELHHKDPTLNYKRWSKQLMISYLSIIPSLATRFLAKPEKIYIDLKYKDYQKLAFKRKQALQDGVLVNADDSYVPADIRYNGKTLKAKIRLKGDLVDFLQGSKWPFRIVIKGRDTLFGMKVFSIHDPKARNFAYEWFFHKVMQREGIIALRYDFINVFVNGKFLGLYALEEHFEKRLIEHNERREGPIVAFSEEADIHNIRHFGWPQANAQHRIDFYGSEVDLYRPSTTLENPVLKEQFLKAKDLLEAFRNEKVQTCDAFDCAVLARYLALLDLTNGRHAEKYGNLKFYYNPVTSKLEPISFDAEFVGEDFIFGRGIHMENWFVDTLNPTLLFFKDNRLYKKYLQELTRISDPAYLDQLFRDLDDEINEKMKLIHTEYPFRNFQKTRFYQYQEMIRNVLNVPFSIYGNFEGIREKDGASIIELSVSNMRATPVEVRSIQVQNQVFLPESGEKYIVPSIGKDRLMQTRKFNFIIPENFQWSDEFKRGLILNYSYLGLKDIRRDSVVPWPHFDEQFLGKDFIRNLPDLSQFPFLNTDFETRTVMIQPGSWQVDQSIIFPKDFTILAHEGTELNLTHHARILSYSPFRFFGSNKAPIRIYSDDGSGQGILVIGEDSMPPSVLQYVIFDNLSAPSHGGWSVTGAVTFYQAKVEISLCQFLNSRSEDALNVVRSQFSIDNSVFSSSFSDALDSDFSQGKVTNSRFEKSGNDGIDLSKSRLTLGNTTFSFMGDKGVSVGEQSLLIADLILVDHAKIGLASKDFSRLTVSNSRIENSSIGASAYQKKTEFGPALISLVNTKIENVQKPFLIEVRSQLNVDGVEFQEKEEHVYQSIEKPEL